MSNDDDRPPSWWAACVWEFVSGFVILGVMYLLSAACGCPMF